MYEQNMLTTMDNPYNPFDDFTSWFLFDIEKGYNTCGRLARLANVSDEMSVEEQNAEIERAMDTLIKRDFLNVYQKVSSRLANAS